MGLLWTMYIKSVAMLSTSKIQINVDQSFSRRHFASLQFKGVQIYSLSELYVWKSLEEDTLLCFFKPSTLAPDIFVAPWTVKM